MSPAAKPLHRRTIPRRALLAAAALAPSLPRPSRAADLVWRLGHGAPPDFPLHLRLTEAAATIADRSAGKLRLQIYPDSTLGSPAGLLAQLQAGTLDAAPQTGQSLGSALALATLPMTGFAFADYPSVWSAMDGTIGDIIRAQIQERIGLVAMDRCWNFGFRQVTTSGKFIREPADLENLRLRTPPEADLITLFQALKALPTPVPLAALAQALKTHAIDGQESALPLVKAAKLYQVQSACALTNHVWDGYWMCISAKSWTALPKDLRLIVAAAFDAGALLQRQDTLENEARTRRELEALGMTFTTTSTPAFRQALRKTQVLRSPAHQIRRHRMGRTGKIHRPAAITRENPQLAQQRRGCGANSFSFALITKSPKFIFMSSATPFSQ